MKKNVKTITLAIIAILIIFIGSTCISYNTQNQHTMIMQFGQIVNVKTEPGIFFRIPFIQSVKKVYVGEQVYDVHESEVITSDKKNMIANCYVTWQIEDSKKYYQTVSSESIAQGRLDVAVYNSMKNIISSTTQDDVIAGKNGTLGRTILKDITSVTQYGIDVTDMEMKLLDLPNDNKQAVYERMISERQVIAAEYEANGEKEAQNIRSSADANVRTIVSNAEVVAANTEAEGETVYFQTLSEAYGASAERRDFYNFIIGLDAMKESLSNGGTITIDENSPLYDILNNQ